MGLAASAVAAPACDGDEDKIRAADFQTDVREGLRLIGVTPATPVDYLELRSGFQLSPPSPDAQAKPNVVERTGVVCATAVDKAKCLATVDELRPDLGPPPNHIDYDRRYLVFTRGDEVGAITTADELRPFLAPFENAKDAALLVENFTEHRIKCGGPNIRPSGDGFELYTATGIACGKGTHRDDNVVRVARDGQLTVVATRLLPGYVLAGEARASALDPGDEGAPHSITFRTLRPPRARRS